MRLKHLQCLLVDPEVQKFGTAALKLLGVPWRRRQGKLDFSRNSLRFLPASLCTQRQIVFADFSLDRFDGIFIALACSAKFSFNSNSGYFSRTVWILSSVITKLLRNSTVSWCPLAAPSEFLRVFHAFASRATAEQISPTDQPKDILCLVGTCN